MAILVSCNANMEYLEFELVNIYRQQILLYGIIVYNKLDRNQNQDSGGSISALYRKANHRYGG